MNVCMYVCMYVCLYVCMYVCIYQFSDSVLFENLLFFSQNFLKATQNEFFVFENN